MNIFIFIQKMSCVNVLLREIGIAIIPDANTDIAIIKNQKKLYTISFVVEGYGHTMPTTAIINQFLIAPTTRDVLRYSMLYPQICISERVDANHVVDSFMLNPINIRKELLSSSAMAEQLGNDILKIVEDYVGDK